MRMGQTLRYSSSKDPGPPTVDGLANFWHQTITPDGTRTQLEAGISPIEMVRAVDGRRTPAILLRSSPHKAGSEVTLGGAHLTTSLAPPPLGPSPERGDRIASRAE